MTHLIGGRGNVLERRRMPLAPTCSPLLFDGSCGCEYRSVRFAMTTLPDGTNVRTGGWIAARPSEVGLPVQLQIRR